MFEVKNQFISENNGLYVRKECNPNRDLNDLEDEVYQNRYSICSFNNDTTIHHTNCITHQEVEVTSFLPETVQYEIHYNYKKIGNVVILPISTTIYQVESIFIQYDETLKEENKIFYYFTILNEIKLNNREVEKWILSPRLFVI